MMEVVTVYEYVYLAIQNFGRRHGVRIFGVTIDFSGPEVTYIAWLDAVEGHPLLCPLNPSGELGEVVLTELCILSDSNTFYCPVPSLSPSGLFWIITWTRLELDWLWVELEVVSSGVA